MLDTMEMEGAVEEGGVELSADESRLVKTLRDKNLSAGQVSDRIEAHMSRPAAPPPAAAPAPQMVSMSEVRKMFTEYDQKAKQSAQAAEAQRAIKAAIGKVVDDSGITKRPKRRDRIVDDAFTLLCGCEDVTKLNDEDFQKILVDESNKAIAEEREDGGTPPQSSTTPSKEDEGRKTAAETMGQTNGNEPPPKSAAQTEQPLSGTRVNASNVDESFGAADRNWAITDAEIEQESAREGEKFLRKARGG